MLQSMGSQRVGYDWATELNWTEDTSLYLSIYYILHQNHDFPSGSVIKNPPANAGDVGSTLGLGRPSGEGNDNPLQDSCLGNSMDRGAWKATVHGIAKESDKT